MFETGSVGLAETQLIFLRLSTNQIQCSRFDGNATEVQAMEKKKKKKNAAGFIYFISKHSSLYFDKYKIIVNDSQ